MVIGDESMDFDQFDEESRVEDKEPDFNQRRPVSQNSSFFFDLKESQKKMKQTSVEMYVEDIKEFHEYTNEDKYERERNRALKNFVGDLAFPQRH